MPSCRSALDTMRLDDGENAALMMARYVKTLDDKSSSKTALFASMSKAVSNAKDLYSQAFRVRRNILSEIAVPKTFATVQPLAVGLGNSNVIESGLSLNYVYGVPMLPGSSIKGITAHYCSEIFGAENPDCRGPNPDSPLEPAGRIYEALFGKIAPEKEQEAGLLRFYDAWILPESVNECLVTDVMTPHYGSDFKDPIPINFLTVRGNFEIFIGCNNLEADREWIKFAFGLVEAALSNNGIGGKIRASYGKMKRLLSDAEKKAQDEEKKAREEEARLRAEEEKREKDREQNRGKGFMFIKGDEVEVICVKVEVNKKGKEKQQFAFKNDCGDEHAIHFNPKFKVSEGELIRGIITDIANGSYTLQRL